MADNIVLSAGTGDGGTVATDEVSSRHFQIVKLAEGGDGVAVLVSGSTPLSVKGTTDFPLPVTVVGGTLGFISGTVTVVGSVNTNAATGTAPISGSVSIIGGTVGANITGGSVHVEGTVAVTAGSLNTFITGGSVTTTATIGTIQSILGTVNVVASPGDAQAQWGAGSLDLIQVGLMTPTGTVAVNAGLPISGTLAAISGTVTVVGSVTTGVTVSTGTTPVFGTVTQPVYITGSVSVPGTVTVVGSVTTGVTVTPGTTPVFGTVTMPVYVTGSVQVTTGSVNVSNQGGSVAISSGSVDATIKGSVQISTGGSLNVSNQGGSVQVSSGSLNISNQGGSVQVSAIVGTLPDKNQNQVFRVLAGSTSIALGSVGGTGDYLSHITIVVGSTDANEVILADHTQGTFTIFPSVPGPGKGTYTVAIDAYSRFGPWRLSVGGGANTISTGRFTN
jgi:hypothetical protein